MQRAGYRVIGSTLLVGLSILLIGSVTAAQEIPKAEVFVGYSYLNVDTNNLTLSRPNANGWEASVSGNLNQWFALEGDVSGYYKSWTVDIPALLFGPVNVDVSDYGFVGGPRINFRPLFVHALVGADHLTGSALGLSASQDSFAGAFGGGVQWDVNPKWAVRVSGDYVLTRHNIFKVVDLSGPNYTQNSFRVSAGIVFNFRGTSGPAPSRSQNRQIGRSEEAVLLGVTVYADGNGVRVVSVRDGSPAANAGIQTNDLIATIDGQPVHSAKDIETAVATSATGTIRIRYFERGILEQQRDVRVR